MSETKEESKKCYNNHNLLGFAYQNELFFIKKFLSDEPNLNIIEICDKRDYNCKKNSKLLIETLNYIK